MFSDRIFFLTLGRLGILLTPCGYPYSILAAVSPDPNRCHGREVLGTSLKKRPPDDGGLIELEEMVRNWPS